MVSHVMTVNVFDEKALKFVEVILIVILMELQMKLA
jgi:hypothetical protein